MTLSAQTSRKQTNHSKTGKSVSHRRLCVLLALAILLVLVAGTGLLSQALASAVDASRYPPPGRLVDRGGYRLHLHCSGTSRASRPLVLLDAGLGGSSLDWSLVQPGVATFTRVCSYDRAGYGWSDAGPEPRTSGRLVSELHMLLVNAGVPGPYVLVGHSFGGLTMRLFASTYPQEVAGLVLVDSSHEEDPTARQEILSGQPQLSTCSGLAPFGIVRLFGLLDHFASAYPAAVQPVVKAHFSQTRFCGTWDDESAAWGESTAQVRAARTHHKLGNLPLVVITHGKRLDASWQAFQNDLANLSSRSTHLMATRSGHAIMLDQPDLVSAAIKEVVTRVEKHRADLALSYLANLAMTYFTYAFPLHWTKTLSGQPKPRKMLRGNIHVSLPNR